MVLLIGSQDVSVFVLLATAATAMIMDETPPPPVASSGAAENPAPVGPPDQTSYLDGQPRNVYTYPMGKQYSTYYTGGSPNQYGSAARDGGNPGDGYADSSSYQTMDQGAPQYVGSFRGFSNMAVSKPYTYYIAHPGEASGAHYEARNEGTEGLQEANANSNMDGSQNGKPFMAKRSLLELLGTSHESLLPSSLSSSYSASSLLGNARVQLSFSGGYPTNSPRYTYLTFIIPGDICALNQQETAGSSTLLGAQANTFVNQQIPYSSSFSSFSAPVGSVSATGYGTASQYQYGGSAVQNQATYSTNGQTVYRAIPGTSQTFVTGGVLGSTAGAFMNSIDHANALRSLDDHDHVQNAEVSKPPQSLPAPASANPKPNETPAFAPAARSIST